MKKITFLLVILATVSFGCSNSDNNPNPDENLNTNCSDEPVCVPDWAVDEWTGLDHGIVLKVEKTNVTIINGSETYYYDKELYIHSISGSAEYRAVSLSHIYASHPNTGIGISHHMPSNKLTLTIRQSETSPVITETFNY